MSEVLALIPMRQGSKGVKKKNARVLNGKPLFQWTVDSALQASIDRVVVNSDSTELLSMVADDRVEKYLRPAALGRDAALTLDVVLEYLDRSLIADDCIFLLLQPTCPFRTPGLINDVVEMLQANNNISVCTVAPVDGNHPFRMKVINDGFLKNFVDQGFEDMRPRQDLPDVYIRSGSIYGARVGKIKQQLSLLPGNVVPALDTDLRVNIDTELDFTFAEFIAEKGLLM